MELDNNLIDLRCQENNWQRELFFWFESDWGVVLHFPLFFL